MSANPLLINKTMKYGDWLFDEQLERADNAACVQYDRREEIANAVTFADVIEEMASFSDARTEEFMSALRRGMQPGKNTMFVLIDQAMERVIDERMKEA
jgi:hypothetical protein